MNDRTSTLNDTELNQVTGGQGEISIDQILAYDAAKLRGQDFSSNDFDGPSASGLSFQAALMSLRGRRSCSRGAIVQPSNRCPVLKLRVA